MNKNKTIIAGVALVIALLVFAYLNFFGKHTVTFEAKIGPGVQAAEVKHGDLVKRPSDPTADGYEFLGWYLDNQEYDFTTPVVKNITLTAKWQELTE